MSAKSKESTAEEEIRDNSSWQKGCRKRASVHLWRSDRGGERVSQRCPKEGGKSEAEAAKAPFHVCECVFGMMTEQTTSSVMHGLENPPWI